MKAMILAAGLGTRMRPLTNQCPKPLLPLMLQPMLAYLLGQLRAQDLREVIINTHHHAPQLTEWLGDGRRWDLRLTLSFEPEILGTAGAMKRVESLLQGEPFLVINADVLVHLDMRAVWHWHCQHQAMVTMVLRPDPAARAFGAVVVDAADRVLHINGRPTTRTAATEEEMIFTGIQIVSPQVLERIPPDRFITTTAEVYPDLLANNEAVYGYRHTGYWMDIGVPERYLQAHWALLDGQLGDQWQERLPSDSTVVRHPYVTAPGVEQVTLVPPVVLGADVTFAPGAHVGPYAILGSGCHIAEGARVQESVLWERVYVGPQAQVHRCILGTEVHITASRTVSNMVCVASEQPDQR